MFISYAQQGEDVVLRRAFPHDDGFFIDVGANHPVDGSVTKAFSDAGWKGINVEPSRLFDVLQRHRPWDVNLRAGLSDREGELEFYEFPEAEGLHTFVRAEADRARAEGFDYVTRRIPVTTLARVCEQHVRREIDFVSVDVEGHERAVLAGGDWRRWRPRVVVVEATRPRSSVSAHEEWEPILLKADYLFASFDGVNRYYVRREDRHLADVLRVPPNALDLYVPFASFSRVGQLLVSTLLLEIRRLKGNVRAAHEHAARLAEGLERAREEVRRLSEGFRREATEAQARLAAALLALAADDRAAGGAVAHRPVGAAELDAKLGRARATLELTAATAGSVRAALEQAAARPDRPDADDLRAEVARIQEQLDLAGTFLAALECRAAAEGRAA